ncbi:MAG: retropepsin-like aspartic protease [Planctomycetota bacterium]|jgi:predicted aspartyl protease
MSCGAWKRLLCRFSAVFLTGLVVAGGCSEEPAASSGQNVLAEFEIREEAEVILLPVTFEQERYMFMLDTGSTATSFDNSLRPQLGQPTRTGKAMTAGGPMVVEAYRAPEAFLGPLNIKDANEVLCADHKMLSLIDGEDIRGVIGMNFLKDYVVRIDFDECTLSFLHSLPEQDAEWPEPLEIRYDSLGLPHIVARLGDDTEVDFLIDTGVNATGFLASEVFEELVSNGEVKTSETLAATPVGVMRNRDARVEKLSVGPFEYRNVIFGRGPLCVLGLTFWGRHAATFDFPNSKVYLEKGKAFDRIDEVDMSGLHLLRISGEIVVHSVDENSPAQEAGITAGDVIVKVDSKDAGRYDMWELRRLLRSQDKRRVDVTIKRGDQLKEFSFLLKKKI